TALQHLEQLFLRMSRPLETRLVHAEAVLEQVTVDDVRHFLVRGDPTAGQVFGRLDRAVGQHEHAVSLVRRLPLGGDADDRRALELPRQEVSQVEVRRWTSSASSASSCAWLGGSGTSITETVSPSGFTMPAASA